ncbi:enoyl-CoA hydratase/isomerase family protein [Ammoniphilus sp. 3BR4]|uniref:enoyl-CoA hydratase/isomerase family protein n=1 Tax=Ammoniphilus sp. 3BR4 TaxID=3158265 RepID=UPI003467C6DF
MMIYKDGVIGVIKINRQQWGEPLNIKTLLGIEKALDQWKDHNGIKIIVLAMESDLLLDAEQLRVRDKAVQDMFMLYLSNLGKKIKSFNKVTMVVINSHIYAEELVLAMACDIRIAVENIKLLNLTGEIISSQHAKEIGLVSQVVPKEELWQTVLDRVSQVLVSNSSSFKIKGISRNEMLNYSEESL